MVNTEATTALWHSMHKDAEGTPWLVQWDGQSVLARRLAPFGACCSAFTLGGGDLSGCRQFATYWTTPEDAEAVYEIGLASLFAYGQWQC